MILKLSWLRLFVKMLYGIAALVGVVALGMSIIARNFQFGIFAWAFGIAFNALVLDVLCSIGETVVRIEADQNFTRLWIEQLSHKIK
jgi:hypothetical protein